MQAQTSSTPKPSDMIQEWLDPLGLQWTPMILIFEAGVLLVMLNEEPSKILTLFELLLYLHFTSRRDSAEPSCRSRPSQTSTPAP